MYMYICVYIAISPVKFGVSDSYQYPWQDGNKFIILM